MSNFSRFKIPIITGINDNPEEPNFENNGKGNNGAYFNERFNAALDALDYQAPVFESLTSNAGPTTIEVGAKIFGSSTPITLSYAASNPTNVAVANFYAGGSLINNNSYASGAVLTYSLSNYNAAPNIYMAPASYTWSVQGTDVNGDTISGAASITASWRYRTYTGYSDSPSVEDITLLTGTSNSLTRLTSVSKPVTGSATYLYVFLPVAGGGVVNGWSPYTSFKTTGGFNAVMANVNEVMLTRLGVVVTYKIYRLQNPTSGAVTLTFT